ncbi:ATP-binding protein [Streptacidiphilus sp. PAMC 29251]
MGQRLRHRHQVAPIPHEQLVAGPQPCHQLSPHPRNPTVSSTHLLVSQLTLAEIPSAVPWARRHADEVLRRWRVPPGTTETALLLVSELAANSARHTQNPIPGPLSYSALASVGTFAIGLRLTGPRLILQASDRDPRPPVIRTAGSAADGSGLRLVNTLSHQWGHYRPRDATGKVIWAELRLDAPTESWPSASERDSPTDPRMLSRILAGLHCL